MSERLALPKIPVVRIRRATRSVGGGVALVALIQLAVPPAVRAEEPPATAPTAAPAPEAALTSTGAPSAPGTPPSTPLTLPVEPVLQPKIVAEILEHDAGPVRKGKRVELDFVLANQGEATLKIKEAQPSCGCTVASFDKEIAVGATGKVHVVLDTSSFDGAIAKHVTVLSNDPVTPRLVLTIKAEVQAFLRVAPTYARILQVQTLEPEPAVLHFWATDGWPIEIEKIETPFPWVVASVRRATDAERTPEVAAEQWRLEISLTADAPLGPLRESIRVVTNHPEEPELEIPLSGNVRQVLHVQPAEADFGKLVRPAKDARRFVVKLFNFGKEPLEIRSFATDLPFVTAAISPEDPGRRFRVELRLAPDAPKGKFEGRFRVETSSSAMPSIEIPVRGKVD